MFFSPYASHHVENMTRAWVVSAASVVDELHRAGVVWGSVRPENFIVKPGDRGFPVLLAKDFSRAALASTGAQRRCRYFHRSQMSKASTRRTVSGLLPFAVREMLQKSACHAKGKSHLSVA